MLNIGINEIITKNLKLESINKIWVIFLIFLYCLVINGCYTTYYSTQTDPQIIFDKKEILSIKHTKEIPSVTEKKFALSLAEIMIENGFKINGFNADLESTNCYITFSIDTYSYQSIGNYTTYNTSALYIPGTYNGNVYNPGKIIRTITPNTNIYTTTNVKRDIGVSIVCRDSKDKQSQVWFGFISADINSYNKYKNNIIRNLVGLIGKDFDGYLDIE